MKKGTPAQDGCLPPFLPKNGLIQALEKAVIQGLMLCFDFNDF